MKIYIKDIGPEGLDIDHSIPVEALELGKDDYIHFTRPLLARAKVDRVENTILIKAKVNSRIQTYCSRTLKKIEKDWSVEFLLDFEVDGSFEYIDFDEEVRQEVTTRLPLKVLADGQGEIEEAKEEDVKTYQPFVGLKDIN